MVNETEMLSHSSGRQQATDMDVQAPGRTFSSRSRDTRKAGRKMSLWQRCSNEREFTRHTGSWKKTA